MSVDNLSSEEKIDSYSYALRLFFVKLPSSNCEKVIMLPVCSWDDVAYGIYETDGRIVSASKYGSDVYANALDFFVNYNIM